MRWRVLFCCLATLVFAVSTLADVKVERKIEVKDTEIVSSEEVCLGVKIVRKDFYTYKNKTEKELDSCVVWVYQAKDNYLIITHKFKTLVEEIWESVDDSVLSVDYLLIK